MPEPSVQGTDQWLLDRAGKFTGSEFGKLLGRKKDGTPLKARSDLIWQVVVERHTGLPELGPDSYSMRWGKDVEPYAREAYEIDTGLVVAQSPFIKHPRFPFAGCSPDGLVGADGGIESKCPKSSAIHLARFIDGMEDEHLPQVQGAMWVTGRPWWDFVSYDPRCKEERRFFRVRVKRDDVYIKKLEEEVIKAEAEVQVLIEKLSRRAA